MAGFARGEEPPKPEKKPAETRPATRLPHALSAVAIGEENPVKPASALPADASQAGVVSARMQADLNRAFHQLSTGLEAGSAPAVDLMTDLPVTVSEEAADARSEARRLMGFLDNNPDRVKPLTELRFEDLMVLPVGLKTNLGDNSQVMIGILKAEFKPTHAELTVFVRMQMQVNDPTTSDRSRDLFFGVDQLRFTREGGFSGGSFRAVLLGDFVLPMRNWTLVLKGGTGISLPGSGTVGTGADQPTYVDIECNGFKEASLAARLIFPRTVIIPYDPTTRKPAEGNGRVGVDFRVVTQNGLRDLLINLSVNNGAAFTSPKFSRVGFQLNELVIDLSDGRNWSNMVFPEGYTGDRDPSWQGVYIQKFAVLLPKEFKSKGGGSSAVSLEANDVLVDRTGFTGIVSYSKERQPAVAPCDARGWAFTLDYFSLRFIQNEFAGGGFGGLVTLPVSNTAFAYAAVIDPSTGYYAASLRTEGNLPVKMPAFRAQGLIYRGSQFDFGYREVNNQGEFYPRVRLSGELSIGTRVGSFGNETDAAINPTVTEDEDVDVENGTASFRKIQFTDLVIQTEQAPYVTIGDFRYNDQGNHRLAGFPVAIVKIAKSALPSATDELWIDFGFRVSLAKDKIAGASVLTLKTRYDQETGKLRFQKVQVQSVLVQANTSAFNLFGYVQVYDNNVVKGFRGGLKVDVLKPVQVQVVANANFGYQKVEDYRYGYVDAYAEVTSLSPVDGGAPALAAGIPTGIGDLLINGAGLGLYFNMKPQFASSLVSSSEGGCIAPISAAGSSFQPSVFAYCPNRQIPFGAKMMLGLVNSTESFRGRFGVEFAMDRQYGINSIALTGNGVFGQSPLNVNAKASGNADSEPPTTPITQQAYYQQMMGFAVQGQTDDELGNQTEGSFTKEALEAKAQQRNQKKYGNQNGVVQEGDIAFSAGVMLGFSPFLLRIEGDVYVNKAGLRGIEPNGRAARVAINFEKNNNYLRFGLPELPYRMGLRYGNTITLGAYLMAGNGVPRFPRPAPEVVAFFPSLRSGSPANNSGLMNGLAAGTAFALGANIGIRVDEGNSGAFVRGYALGGFDLLITSGSTCKPGAWWGQGQVYGILNAEAGLLGTTLVRGALGVYMRGNAFRPTGFGGDVCVQLRKRTRCLTVRIGDLCN